MARGRSSSSVERTAVAAAGLGERRPSFGLSSSLPLFSRKGSGRSVNARAGHSLFSLSLRLFGCARLYSRRRELCTFIRLAHVTAGGNLIVLSIRAMHGLTQGRRPKPQLYIDFESRSRLLNSRGFAIRSTWLRPRCGSSVDVILDMPYVKEGKFRFAAGVNN